MAFTTPRTWVAAQIVTADELNIDIRDNMVYLKDRIDGVAKQFIRTVTDYTTTSTSLVDIDGTNLSLTFTTDGSDVLVIFAGYGDNSGTNGEVLVAVKVDSTDFEITSGTSPTGNAAINLGFIYIFTGLSAASHTFIMRWKVAAGTGTITAGTTLFDVREALGLIA